MIVHQVFAEIYEDTVQNVMVCDNYELANYIARCTYGKEAFAVDCLQYPCSIGDKYRDGRFWHIDEEGKETEIAYVPTAEQEVQLLKADNKELKTSNEDLTLAMAAVIGGASYAE